MNLSRRQFLIANGAALALPTLPSLAAETKSKTKKPSKKLVIMYVPNRHSADRPRKGKRGNRPVWFLGKAVAVGQKSDSVQRFRRGSGAGMHGRGDRPELRALYKSEPKLWKNYWNRTICV